MYDPEVPYPFTAVFSKSILVARIRLLPCLAAVFALAFSGCQTNSGGERAPHSTTAAHELATRAALSPPILNVCSFNIQFLGSSTRRDNVALADLLVPYDIVVVQELIAAPARELTDKPESRQRSAAFFHEMEKRGFVYVLSESDTGRNGPLNNYSTATEWWVTFYRKEKVKPAADIPHGFISSPLAKNDDFDRVPYAFSFRTTNDCCDFVLVSVHLNPDDAQRRAHEFGAIWKWVNSERRQQREQDFIVLGDTNLQNQAELHADTQSNFVSLNDACVATNVNPKGPKPYDHVFFDPSFTTEVDRNFGFHVVNLIQEMRSKWTGSAPYPGDPYEQNIFRFYYSDHNPVSFRIRPTDLDDD